MLLTYLSLSNFRNFTRLETQFQAGPTLLVGANAQGKTSLLEAVHYLSCASSPHTSQERQMINILTLEEPVPVARIVAELQTDPGQHPASDAALREKQKGSVRSAETIASGLQRTEIHRIEIRLILEPNAGQAEGRFRKEILINGIKRRVADLPGLFPAVLFLPKDMQIVEGTPSQRRQMLDEALRQAEPHYIQLHAEYQKVLPQRNALLKQIQEKQAELDQLRFWDEKLCQLGAEIIHRRALALTELERIAAPIHRRLSGGAETLRIAYLPSYDPLSRSDGQLDLPLQLKPDWHNLRLDTIREGLSEALLEIRPQEILRGQSLIGPHRDEIAFLSNGMDLRAYGSRGQNRTAMLALKLAEIDWIYQRTQQVPILLLDEMMAELDRQRRSHLLERVQTARQSILTTADLDSFGEGFNLEAAMWEIEAGQLRVLGGHAGSAA